MRKSVAPFIIGLLAIIAGPIVAFYGGITALFVMAFATTNQILVTILAYCVYINIGIWLLGIIGIFFSFKHPKVAAILLLITSLISLACLAIGLVGMFVFPKGDMVFSIEKLKVLLFWIPAFVSLICSIWLFVVAKKRRSYSINI